MSLKPASTMMSASLALQKGPSRLGMVRLALAVSVSGQNAGTGSPSPQLVQAAFAVPCPAWMWP